MTMFLFLLDDDEDKENCPVPTATLDLGADASSSNSHLGLSSDQSPEEQGPFTATLQASPVPVSKVCHCALIKSHPFESLQEARRNSFYVTLSCLHAFNFSSLRNRLIKLGSLEIRQ